MRIKVGVVAAVCVLFVAALAGWFVYADDDGSRLVRAPAAREMCRSYAERQSFDSDLVVWGPATAGAVAQLGEEHGIDVEPWNEYPADHPVALCTFGSLMQPQIGPGTSTSVCPDGRTVIDGSDPDQTKVIVDARGRSSENMLDEQLSNPLSSACS